MKVKNLMITQRKKVRRCYSGSYDYSGLISELHAYLEFHFPKQIRGLELNELNGGEFGDFWVEGDGGHALLSAKYSVELPPDYLEFARKYQHYALITRNCIHLWNAKEVEEMTLALRDGEDVDKSSPIRLYRFARNFGEPSHFMFRWNHDGSFRDVACASYTDFTEKDILGEDSEKFGCDKDFSSWLDRMIRTDGAPLHPGFPHEEDFFINRVNVKL